MTWYLTLSAFHLVDVCNTQRGAFQLHPSLILPGYAHHILHAVTFLFYKTLFGLPIHLPKRDHGMTRGGGGLWCYTLQVKYGKVVFSDTQKIRYPLVRWTISTGFIETFKQIVMYILVSNVIYSRHSCLIKKGDRSLYKASNISARTVCYFLEKNKQP